ncbi:MAG: four helix bundle protein [Gemmataceae bacterium]
MADGCGRGTDLEFRKALSAATGAGSQLEHLLLLARDLGYLLSEKLEKLAADVIEVKKMLVGLIHNLNG